MTTTPAARVSGTIKANAARLADQAEALAAPLVGQHEALRSHHLETAAALRILAAIQPDPEPVLLDETSLRARIGDIGNQIHNLACRHQNDEDLSVNLGELSSQLWALARIAPATPSSAGMVSVEAAALESLLHRARNITAAMKIAQTAIGKDADRGHLEAVALRYVRWQDLAFLDAALRALAGKGGAE